MTTDQHGQNERQDGGMTTNSVFNITERVMRQASRIRQALGDADLNNSEAEAATEAAGYKIGRNRIAQLRAGEVEPKEVELHIIAKVTGADERFVRGEEYVFVSSSENRDLSSYTPGSLKSFRREPLWTADILNSNRGIDHELGGCLNCLLDPDHHVTGDYTDPLPEELGTQLVIDITRIPAA